MSLRYDASRRLKRALGVDKNIIFIIIILTSDNSAVSQRDRRQTCLEFDGDGHQRHLNCAPTHNLLRLEGLKVSLPPLPLRGFPSSGDQSSAVLSSCILVFCCCPTAPRMVPLRVKLERHCAQLPPPTPWRSARSSFTSTPSGQTPEQPRPRGPAPNKIKITLENFTDVVVVVVSAILGA